MWGDNLQKRGLFATIFGKQKPPPPTAKRYELLNSWQTVYTPFSGNAYADNIVRASVNAFARRVAKVQPRHIRRGEGKFSDVTEGNINRLLQRRPNPYTTAYKFYYRLATQYKLYNNAFAYPVWNSLSGKLEAIYNVNAQSVELIEYQGELFLKLSFSSGNTYIAPYVDMIHIGGHFNTNDIFGESNKPLGSVLDTANSFHQSMKNAAELVGVVRGILEVQAGVKTEDLNRRRDDFIRDNLRIESNGAGVIVTDAKYKYTPITQKETPIPSEQLQYIKSEIYDYFGVNEFIVQNKETPEQATAFYNGEIEPFYEQCTQAFTNALFTQREYGYGNEILFEGSSLKNEKLNDKTNALKFLAQAGALTLDGLLLAYNLPPIGGEEGSRRIQTLNFVNAERADEYQLGSDKPKKALTVHDDTDNADGEENE